MAHDSVDSSAHHSVDGSMSGSMSGGADGSIVLHETLEHHDTPFDLAADARAGLAAFPKTLSPKYFYDARGSDLFEQITEQPEYYQTTTEKRILERCATGLVERLRPRVLVEFGSGSSYKTRVLLDALRDAGLLYGYGPLDVSEDAVRAAAEALIADYPGLVVEGVIGDFEHPHELPFPRESRLLAFLGSTIGNFEPDVVSEFLSSVAARMSPGEGFLIGFDLIKDRARLEAAYNDAAGVTAEFNLNILRVLNRELDANFDLESFRHRAFYNEAESRIEMHLVSLRAQRVTLPGIDLEIDFAEGETVRTELSHKYTRESVEQLLAPARLNLVGWQTDEDNLFALALASAEFQIA
ncbi:MAG: L-histidine N(alpha)-methyltransferase [Gemmatimonadota bacterium]